MNQQISYSVRRNVAAKDQNGHACKITVAMVSFPDGSLKTVAIPEGLLSTVPPQAVDDFIAQEVETAIGYEVTRH